MSTLNSEHTSDKNLDEVLLANAEHFEWLLSPMPRSSTPPGHEGGLVFHKFNSMSQTWSRSDA
ncbi:hypothetical protein [Streptomyces griseus]|uniref:hypothetical protein n=1 Tax=Streptomyces griseus TaxID=1911 RepID=UPI00131C3F58|nr:hypothetical protein [Streptomyces griseus]